MAGDIVRPKLVYADASGDIYDDPDLEMLVRNGRELMPPRPGDWIPLPPESEFFLLPGRRAVGLDPETGELEAVDGLAVAAFVCPGYTLTGLAAFVREPNAPVLPLFAYGALGFLRDRFYVCAKRIDTDARQVFRGIPDRKVQEGATALLKRFPDNRLIRHLSSCALTYCCPAARNLALGRFEAPLPTATACNAACVGCISLQEPGSGFPSTQNRIAFTPSPAEVVAVMRAHAERERRPVFSFGQGCEGEPLTQSAVIAEAIAAYRAGGGKGTINMNTNASMPLRLPALAGAGLDSVRVSLNSARASVYEAYYRPKGYTFGDVAAFAKAAKDAGLYVSLNYLYHPGVSDTEDEIAALIKLVTDCEADLIQMRNLNIDPDLYQDVLEKAGAPAQAAMGFANFTKRLRKNCPWTSFGYFNPYLAPLS
ncbi:MAG: radical SAM protein [Desulfovibrionaceae bacterium]|nr:radical SAM protein [Desulfovibrionaceae bacterium]MBF0512598.1 radical SAM protein [Desulfovibrionaceae bacterium]